MGLLYISFAHMSTKILLTFALYFAMMILRGGKRVKDRLKALRKELGLTQEKFAERLSMKRNSIANYEIGRNEPIDAVIALICREFNVSEAWLRTGDGDMFLPVSRSTDIARLTKRLLDEESSSFKNRFISMLSNLSEEEWELLERKVKELASGEII